MKKWGLVTALVLGASSLAMAQTATTGFNEQQVKQKLQAAGYSDINVKPMQSRSLTGSSTAGSGTSTPNATNGISNLWTGTALHNGKQVNVEVDDQGKITEK
jgi:hypothetical protein